MATNTNKSWIPVFIVCYSLVTLCRGVLDEAVAFCIWLVTNYIAYRYLLYDSHICAEKVIAMTNKAQEKQAKVGTFLFLMGEVANPTINKINEEDRRFEDLFTKACAQYAAFFFFSTSVLSIYSSPSFAMVLLVITGLGYLTKPELDLLADKKPKPRIMYFDYFALRGALVLNEQEGNPAYIGVFNKWFYVSKTKK